MNTYLYTICLLTVPILVVPYTKSTNTTDRLFVADEGPHCEHNV